ncbi:hypothetical protein DPEC_G00318990 [Dallia pectoralis]|uniref:Uncharacterized protein n=1 Tax=Dallia pectoralis TaxID=75939 RepID=A0ACC2F9H1_DALPE|nr:hypothetical protein DPEC_G00318990 [Dallia pectoralis]
MKKLTLPFFVFYVLLQTTHAKESPPKVQVYSRNPGEYGKVNALICHCFLHTGERGGLQLQSSPPDKPEDLHLGSRYVRLCCTLGCWHIIYKASVAVFILSDRPVKPRQAKSQMTVAAH